MKARKMHIVLFITTLVCLIFSCRTSGKDENPIIIFAGAGMKTPLEKIGKQFFLKTGLTVFHDFQGSGSLLNKIISGTIPDIYIPASMAWADKCEKNGNVIKKIALAYHEPVIVFNPDKVKITSIFDLSSPGITLAIGKIDVAAIGNVSKNIFEKSSLKKSGLTIAAYSHTVKQIIYYIKQGHATAGIVWKADALEEDSLKYITIPKKYYTREQIPLCIMKNSINKKNKINRYIEFMFDKGLTIFRKQGFQLVDHNIRKLKKRTRSLKI